MTEGLTADAANRAGRCPALPGHLGNRLPGDDIARAAGEPSPDGGPVGLGRFRRYIMVALRAATSAASGYGVMLPCFQGPNLR